MNLHERVPSYVSAITLCAFVGLTIFIVYAAMRAQVIGKNWVAADMGSASLSQ